MEGDGPWLHDVEEVSMRKIGDWWKSAKRTALGNCVLTDGVITAKWTTPDDLMRRYGAFSWGKMPRWGDARNLGRKLIVFYDFEHYDHKRNDDHDHSPTTRNRAAIVTAMMTTSATMTTDQHAAMRAQPQSQAQLWQWTRTVSTTMTKHNNKYNCEHNYAHWPSTNVLNFYDLCSLFYDRFW